LGPRRYTLSVLTTSVDDTTHPVDGTMSAPQRSIEVICVTVARRDRFMGMSGKGTRAGYSRQIGRYKPHGRERGLPSYRRPPPAASIARSEISG
jgi:hypothetical protein